MAYYPSMNYACSDFDVPKSNCLNLLHVRKTVEGRVIYLLPNIPYFPLSCFILKMEIRLNLLSSSRTFCQCSCWKFGSASTQDHPGVNFNYFLYMLDIVLSFPPGRMNDRQALCRFGTVVTEKLHDKKGIIYVDIYSCNSKKVSARFMV